MKGVWLMSHGMYMANVTWKACGQCNMAGMRSMEGMWSNTQLKQESQSMCTLSPPPFLNYTAIHTVWIITGSDIVG